jgi:hypothetical protein
VGYRSWVAIAGTARSYALVCNAPCDTKVPLGAHRMALAQGGGRAVEVDEPVRFAGPSTLHVHYESRLGMRVAGWVILGVASIAGTILIYDAASKTTQDCTGGFCTQAPKMDEGEVAAGLITTTVGSLLSLAFILQRDQAHIELVPQSTARLLPLPGRSERVNVGPSEAPGVGVRLRF